MKVLQLCEEAQDPESFVSRDGETTQSYPGEILLRVTCSAFTHIKGSHAFVNESQVKIRFEKMLLISYTFWKRTSPILISDKSTE